MSNFYWPPKEGLIEIEFDYKETIAVAIRASYGKCLIKHAWLKRKEADFGVLIVSKDNKVI